MEKDTIETATPTLKTKRTWSDLLTATVFGEELLAHKVGDGAVWVFRSQVASVFGLDKVPPSTLRRAYRICGCTSSVSGPQGSLAELRKRQIVHATATHVNMVSLLTAVATLQWLEEKRHIHLLKPQTERPQAPPLPLPPAPPAKLSSPTRHSKEEEQEEEEKKEKEKNRKYFSLLLDEEDSLSDAEAEPSTPPLVGPSSICQPRPIRRGLSCYGSRVEGMDEFVDWMEASKLENGAELSASTFRKTRQKLTYSNNLHNVFISCGLWNG